MGRGTRVPVSFVVLLRVWRAAGNKTPVSAGTVISKCHYVRRHLGDDDVRNS